MSAINMINAKIPTKRSRHIDIQHFAIQDWKEAGDIIMRHVPGVLNPLGWVLHARHARRIMGHYPLQNTKMIPIRGGNPNHNPTVPSSLPLDNPLRLGEGVEVSNDVRTVVPRLKDRLHSR